MTAGAAERQEAKAARFLSFRIEGRVNALDARLDALQSRFAWNLAWALSSAFGSH